MIKKILMFIVAIYFICFATNLVIVKCKGFNNPVAKQINRYITPLTPSKVLAFIGDCFSKASKKIK